jgi:general secretion pathway protein A
VRVGARGPAVDWVRARVSPGATATANANGDDLFDTTLADAVLRFQRTHGLAADGVVGPETLFALAAADAAGPHLQRTLE